MHSTAQDRTQVLKKIPVTNHDLDGLETNAELNHSVTQVLLTHYGIGVQTTQLKSSERGKKDTGNSWKTNNSCNHGLSTRDYFF